METDPSAVEHLYSSKGKVLMIRDGYKFRLFRSNASYKFWRCCHKNCGSAIKFDSDGNVIHQHINHGHEKPKNLQRELIRNRFKQKISDGANANSLIQDELSIIPQQVSDISSHDLRVITRAIKLSAKKKRQSAPLPVLPEVALRVEEDDDGAGQELGMGFDNFNVDSELASQLDLNSMTSSMKRARKSASATEVEVNEGERAVDTEAGPCASTSSMQPAAPEVTAQDDLEFGSFERQMSNVLAFSIPTVEETPAPSHEVDITLGKETQTCTITLADIIETTTDDAFTASSVKVKPIDTLQAKDTSGVEGESKDKEGVQTSNIDINAKTLESAIQRLESVSNKLTAASLVDSYDQFGKYISSVLRGLPIKKVNSLKQKIISEVMEAVAHEESGLPKNVQHTQANVAPRVRSDLRFVKGQSPVSTLPQEPKSYRRKCKCNPIAGNMPLVYPSIFTPTPPLMVRQVPIVASSMGSAASMNAPPSFEGFTSRNPPPYLDKADLKNVDDSVMAATAPKHTLPAAFGNDQSLSQSPRGRKRRKTAAHPTRNAPSPCETSTPSATTSGDESSRDDQPPDTKEGSHLGGSVQLPDNSRGSRREGVSNVNVDQVLKTDEQDFEMDIEEGNELARIKEDQYLFETVLCGENSGLYIKEEALDPEEPPPPPTNPLTPATCHTCHLCNAKCNSREDLRIHFASAHPGCDAAPCSTSDAAGGGYFNT